MPKFRKRPVVIEAVQWTGSNVDEIATLCDAAHAAGMLVHLDGDTHRDHRAVTNDWFKPASVGRRPCMRAARPRTSSRRTSSGYCPLGKPVATEATFTGEPGPSVSLQVWTSAG